jgi:hypothetical protein
MRLLWAHLHKILYTQFNCVRSSRITLVSNHVLPAARRQGLSQSVACLVSTTDLEYTPALHPKVLPVIFAHATTRSILCYPYGPNCSFDTALLNCRSSRGAI